MGMFPTNPKYRAYEDWIFWMRLSTLSDILFIDKPLIYYDEDSQDSIRNNQESFENVVSYLKADIIKWGMTHFLSHPYKKKLIQSMYKSFNATLVKKVQL